MLVVAPPGSRQGEGTWRGRTPTTSAPLPELREFLMSRRARVSPAEAGLPDGGARRRTPGLRREEVAVLAGVGRVLVPVAGAGAGHLRLPAGPGLGGAGAAAEQRRAAASVRPGRAEPARARSRARGPGHVQGLRRLIDTWMPYPAHIMDAYCNCVLYNDAAAAVLGMRPENTQNCLVDFFTDPLYRSRSTSWGGATPATVVAQFRAASATGPRTRGSGRSGTAARAQRRVRRAVGPAGHRGRRTDPQGARASAGRDCWSWSRRRCGYRPGPT